MHSVVQNGMYVPPESIRAASGSVFSDALWAWRSAAGVVSRLARWRARSPQLYADAYVADCLPKLIAPYVRHEVLATTSRSGH